MTRPLLENALYQRIPYVQEKVCPFVHFCTSFTHKSSFLSIAFKCATSNSAATPQLLDRTERITSCTLSLGSFWALTRTNKQSPATSIPNLVILNPLFSVKTQTLLSDMMKQGQHQDIFFAFSNLSKSLSINQVVITYPFSGCSRLPEFGH